MAREIKYVQPINPTDEERYEMMRIALEEENRIEDFDSLIKLLGPPKDITTIASPRECSGVKVGIIGGGVAGLASAFELRKLGFHVTIFEMQESRIGGRVYTYYFDKDKKYYGELGAMRIPVSHQTTWHYINTFNLQTAPFVQENENGFIYVRNRRARNDPEGKGVMEKIYPQFNLTPWERITPWQELIEYGLGSQLSKINSNMRKELLQIKREYSKEIEYLGSLSARNVLDKMKMSEGAIELISCVSPFIGYLYYNSYIENLQEQYTIDNAYRYGIAGGTVNLPLAFYKSLVSKEPKEYPYISREDLGKILWKNGTTVTGIYKKDRDSKVVLEYKGEKSLEASHESFDFVICTIPFSSLRNVNIYPMFSTEKMQAIKELNYTSSQKTLFMCDERFWEQGGPKERIIGGASFTDLITSNIWYPNYLNYSDIDKMKKNKKYINPDEPGVLLASYNLEQDAIRLGNLDAKMRIPEIKRQVEAVHGLPRGYLDSIVEDYKTINWDSEQGFYGAFCYFMPSQQSLFAYASAKPEYNNRVYFAGEHVSLTHGWIQGSVNSGMKAANNIAEYCKVMSGNEHSNLCY